MSTEIENGKKIEQLLEVDKLPSSSYFIASVNDLSRKISIYNLRHAFNGDTETSNLGNLYYSCEKINEFLDGINTELDQIANQFTNTNKRLDSIYETFGADLGDLQRYVDRIYGELKLADENIRQDVNTKYQTHSKNISDLAARVSTNETNISTLTTNLSSLSKTVSNNYTTLKNRLDGVDTSITNINNNISDINDDIDTINTNIASLGRRVSTNETNISTNATNISTNATDIAAIEKILGSVTGITIGTSVPTTLASNAIYLQYFTS